GSFGGTEDDRVTEAGQASDGSYFVAGSSMSGVSGNKTNGNFGDVDCWVVKLDPNGKKIWDRSFGGTAADWTYCMAVTIDGGCVLGSASSSGLTGNKTSPNYGMPDFWVIRLDANGNKLWENFFGGLVFEILYAICSTRDGAICLADPPIRGFPATKPVLGTVVTISG